MTLKFEGWPWITIGHLFYAPSSFLHHFRAIGVFQKCPNWEKICFDLWPLTLTFPVAIIFIDGNNSWKFHDDTMTETLWKRCDGQTDRTAHGAWSQLKTGQLHSYLARTLILFNGFSSVCICLLDIIATFMAACWSQMVWYLCLRQGICNHHGDVHYINVIMSAMVSNHRHLDCLLPFVQAQIKRKHQSFASLVFVRGIHRWREIPRTKGQ